MAKKKTAKVKKLPQNPAKAENNEDKDSKPVKTPKGETVELGINRVTGQPPVVTPPEYPADVRDFEAGQVGEEKVDTILEREPEKEPTVSKKKMDPGGVSKFRVGNGATYNHVDGHIKTSSGLNTESGDPIDVVFVPHDGEHEIELVKFADLEDVVRSEA